MARHKTHACRNCGAPLAIPAEHDRYFRCNHCGSVLEDVTPATSRQAGRIEITVSHQQFEIDDLQSYAKPVRRVGMLIMMFVLLTVGAAVTIGFLAVGDGARGVTDAQVVVSTERLLLALDRATGAERWSATLTDVVQPNICTDCIARFGDVVVTLTADGVLATTSLASGEPQWSVTLVGTPRQIVDLGGNPAVLDTAGTGLGRAALTARSRST